MLFDVVELDTKGKVRADRTIGSRLDEVGKGNGR